jgi:hypothetical protein
MKIADVIETMKTQVAFERTPTGRPITEKAVAATQAAISDEKNWHNDALKCKNCGIISSSLLVPEGCVNCGSKDLESIDDKVEKGD